jgi:hypothetical protein
MFWIAFLMGAAPVELPVWVSRPDGDDVAQVYPQQALLDQLVGRADLACSVTSGGQLADCASIGEEPEGNGFAEAAGRLADKFHMSPTDRDGQAVAGRPFVLKIRFILPGFFETPVTREFVAPREAGPFGEALLNCRIELDGWLDNCLAQAAPTRELAEAALGFVDTLIAEAPADPTPRDAYDRIAISVSFRPAEP